MSRQPVILTDDQATILVKLMPAILERHPAKARDLRAFAREFIDAVYQATGRVFSPAIYQRWLPVYAPGRSPSTETLASVKREYEQGLASVPPAEDPSGRPVPENLALTIERAVENVMRRAAAGSAVDKRAQVLVEQLQEQLTEAERRARQAESHAAHIAGELRVVAGERDQLRGQLDAGRAVIERLASHVDQLAVELAEIRKFSMTAIDGVRGETRAWQEAAKAAEGRAERLKFEAETFRRLAYAKGAEIPKFLTGQGNT
jgi:hypothetical protein